MDYCSTCRRNLNGVFVCPGCGAYAPDIAPPAHLIHRAVASTTTTHEVWTTERDPGAGPAAPAVEGLPVDETTDGAQSADVHVPVSASGDIEGAALTGEGRAARRRQRARWKKHQRRALAATAVALVGGGLTVAAMPATRPSTTHTHAAPPPEPVTAPATSKTPATTSETPATTKPPVTAGSQEQRGTHPRTAGEVRDADAPAAVPAASTTNRQPSPAPPRTAPAPATDTATDAGPANTAPSGAGAPTEPATTTPARDEQPSAGTGTSLLGGLVSTTPATDPTSPTQVCVVGLCLG
ncbi:hypothetical protein ACFY7C_18060 [Streptomyces sp. NPDC012769]|uniref:SCO2400 family protein n=1 Tax=Streptomyces sp. NPDC012769 TaxID=3364848 RepID=UPI003675D0DA